MTRVTSLGCVVRRFGWRNTGSKEEEEVGVGRGGERRKEEGRKKEEGRRKEGDAK